MLKIQRLKANIVDQDETSHLDLQCLQIQLLLCLPSKTKGLPMIGRQSISYHTSIYRCPQVYKSLCVWSKGYYKSTFYYFLSRFNEKYHFFFICKLSFLQM